MMHFIFLKSIFYHFKINTYTSYNKWAHFIIFPSLSYLFITFLSLNFVMFINYPLTLDLKTPNRYKNVAIYLKLIK